ncbi:DEAD/DEAH box helicase [Candidatus Pacearchaeota archaeon]|nr:DEAD/DEAH box helicase [Candidatus Pacearchaeota archaeon]
MELRPYQSDVIQRLRNAIIGGKKRPILQASTGAGKTFMGCDIILNAILKDRKVLWLANRRELINQTSKSLHECGINHGTIMSGEDFDLTFPVQVSSIQTYMRRIKLSDNWFHDADLVIFDECHVSISASYKKILDMYSDKIIIGLTATPMRGDSRGLSEFYDHIESAIPYQDLIDQGFLVNMRYFAGEMPDLTGIKTVAGDFDKKELAKRSDTVKLAGDIFENWERIAGTRQTIIFTVNVKHSKHLRDKFRNNGVMVEHIDAHTPIDERKQILDDLENGTLQVVTNCGILCEGYDNPIVSCIVIARATKSHGLFLQIAGRGGRTHKDKTDCIIIDHGGNVDRHGFIEDPIHWSLDGKKKACKKAEKREKETTVFACEECGSMFAGKKCPECLTEVPDWGKKIETTQDDLEEVTKTKKKYTMEEKQKWYSMLLGHCVMHNKNKGWAAHTYKDKFKVWPRKLEENHLEPDREVLGFIRHKNIKYAKSRAKNA